MVLVAVGKDEPDDVFSLLDEIADIRQDAINAGQVLFGRKRHAAKLPVVVSRRLVVAFLFGQQLVRQQHDFYVDIERDLHQ